MISSNTIEKAVYDLCVEANTLLNDDVFAEILTAYNSETNIEAKQALQLILNNAKIAYESKKPLCQDTGQVLVFVKIGESINVEDLNKSINVGIQKAYEENFYRKSVVKNALFDRTNTKTNVPCIIYPEIVKGDALEIELLIKGAGAENMSKTAMLSPTASEDEVVDFVKNAVESAGSKPCPPLFIGIGLGGTMEYAGLLSKKALLLKDNIDESHKNLAEKIKKAVNNLQIGVSGFGGLNTVLDVKILTDFTHIACLPAAVTINCHSSRHAKCKIVNDEIIFESQYLVKDYKSAEIDFSDFLKVDTSDIEKLKSLTKGQKVLLSGEIYTARDMAHKRLVELIERGEKLPFELKNKIIFYAGPCPCTDNEVVGSIGPTTSSRMDKFASVLYKNGVIATIGKGNRSEDVIKTVKQVGGLYFTAIGGIASLLSGRFVKKGLVAFEDLGTEAIYKFEVADLPLYVEL